MVEANGPEKTPSAATESASSLPKNAPTRKLLISSNDFIHLNEGNIKNFYKISSCIGRGKSVSFVPTSIVQASFHLKQVVELSKTDRDENACFDRSTRFDMLSASPFTAVMSKP